MATSNCPQERMAFIGAGDNGLSAFYVPWKEHDVDKRCRDFFVGAVGES